MRKRLSILAIGAHPDDFELGCGGTLRQHVKNGDRVYGLVLTRGEKGKHNPTCKECRSSARLIGLEEVTILNFPDTGLRDNGEVISAIREYIRKYKANIVYGHTVKDCHQDHRYAALALKSAVNIRDGIKAVYLFEGPSTDASFEPHHHENITSTFNFKLRAIKKYESQLERGGSILDLDWVEDKALGRGNEIKPRNKKGKIFYAEAFEINHTVNY